MEQHEQPVASEAQAGAPMRSGWTRLPPAELAVGGGAILGVCARWLITTLTAQYLPTSFPLATLLINLLGCLLIGLLQTLFLERIVARPLLQLALVVGLLGGFTTFSTFSVETVQLLQAGQIGVALLYQTLSLAGGLGAVLLGRALALAAWRR